MQDQRKYVIMTDSACDMPQELEAQSGVDIMSFDIAVDGKNYTERKDFTFDEYYDILRSCTGVPSTAHITVPRFLSQFEKYYADGVEQVLYISINANGSATHGAACMARDSFLEAHPNSKMKIHIVDSHTYSMAYGWFVAEAARKLQNGAEMSDVLAWLEESFASVEIVLAAYTLGFMKKSGRISAAAAFAGELLGMRPIVSLIDGESVVQKKVRGDKEVTTSLMDFADKNMDDTYFYAIGGTDEAKMEELAELCKKKWKNQPFSVFKLGAAVSTNTGPDAIAIVYMGKPRR